MQSLWLHFALLIGSAITIYLSCELFVNGIEWTGRKLAIGQKATGSILAAFGTALPESVVTFVAVAFGTSAADKELGIGAALGGPLALATIAYATVGVALFLIGLEGLVPYPQTASLRTISDVLGVRSYAFRIDNVVVLDQDLAKFIALVLLAIAAFLFFRYTPTGTAILAVSQDATAARVVGISVERISLISWAIAGLLGGVAGILLAVPPAGTVTPGAFTGTTLTVAFAAAVLGGMTSLPGAFVGGILLGLIEAFANADSSFVPLLSKVQNGQAELAVFLVLLIVLMFRPRGLLGQEA